MARVGIIGSGNAGANAAFFIAEKAVCDVVLYDIRESLSKGKALDMMEAAPIRTYRTKIEGTDSIEEVWNTDVVVIAAGAVRKPDMRREDLFAENVGLIEEIARRVHSGRRKMTVIVVTEPVDLLTTVMTVESGLPREQVLGVGGLLDSTRLRYAISRDLDLSMESVSALVIGRHSDEMIGLARYTRVSGVPALNLMLPEQFESLVNEVRKAGDFIVDLAQRSTAYYAPSASIVELVDAVVRDTRRVLPVSIVFKGEYQIKGVAMSIPAVIGEGGVKRVFLPQLQPSELKQLQRSARSMDELLQRRVI